MYFSVVLQTMCGGNVRRARGQNAEQRRPAEFKPDELAQVVDVPNLPAREQGQFRHGGAGKSGFVHKSERKGVAFVNQPAGMNCS